ncbi:MAG: oligosaccharide flippase family protein [Desulfurococcaceae archaeon]
MSDQVELRIASGTLVLSASQLVALLLGVAFSVVIARLLGPEDYGLVGVSLMYPTMIVSILDLGMGNVLIKFTSVSNPRRDLYAWSSIGLRSVLGFIGFTLTYALADVFAQLLARPYIADYIRVLSVYVLALSVLNTLGQIFIGLGRFRIAGSINIAQYVAKGVVAVYLVLLGWGVFGVAVSYSFAYALLCALYFALFLKTSRKPAFSKTALLDIISLAFPLYLASLAGLVVGPIVGTVLAQHASNYDIGNYNVGSTTLSPINVLMYSITASVLSLLPVIEDKAELRNRVAVLVVYSSLILTFLIGGYTAVLSPLVRILYGSGYRDAATYALLLAIGHIVNAVLTGGVLGGYFIVTGFTKWNSIAGVIGALSTLVSALVLIPLFKASGAALSYTIGLAASATVMYIVARKEFSINVSLVSLTKAIIPVIAGIVASQAVLRYFKSSVLLDFVTSGTVYTVVYLAILPLLVDKSTIENIVEFSSKLAYIGFVIRSLGYLYLRLLGLLSKLL